MVYITRTLEKEIFKWLDDKEVLVIKGPRQCGKTTLLDQIKLKYEKKGFKVQKLTMEDPIEKSKFEQNPKEYISVLAEEKTIFLIDEIQYVKEAGKILKLLFDTTNLKFIVTGSSALDINKIAEFLVGRAIFFNLYPFSFEEFLRAKDLTMYKYYLKNKIIISSKIDKKSNDKKFLFLDKLNVLLKEYLLFGGYPRVVLENSLDKKKILLKNIYFTYLEKDIVNLYGIHNKDKVINLIKYLASTMGQLLSYESISKAIKISFVELKELLSILEDTYIIKQLRPFHKNLVTELRKSPKIYFIDIGLRNMVLNQFKFFDLGSHYEWQVFNLFKEKELFFWRTRNKSEVDFIIKKDYKTIIPVEVKSVYKLRRSFRTFISEYSPERGFIANIDKSSLVEKQGETNIIAVPTVLFSD